MKKQFLLMAMAGVALAGCVGNEVEEVTSKKELAKIMFETPVMYNHAESRIVPGEITAGDRSYPTEEDFVVFATEYEGNFQGWMHEHNATLWGTNDRIRVHYNPALNGWEPWNGSAFETYYWNLNMKAGFSAYSPADASGSATYGADGLTITDFTVDPTPKLQYDLMFSSRNVDVTHSNQTFNGYSGTPILFHHALSSIRFAIVSDKTAKLNGISVHNVYNKGTFKENIMNETQEYTLGQNVLPAWNLTNGTKDDFIIYDAIDVAFTESPRFVLELLKLQNPSYDNAKNFLMIPQTFTKTGADNTIDLDNDAYLEVDYQVFDNKGNDDPADDVWIPYTSRVSLAEHFSGEWLLGTRHIYILSLGGSSKIFFAPGVDAWHELDHDAVIQLDNHHVTP